MTTLKYIYKNPELYHVTPGDQRYHVAIAQKEGDKITHIDGHDLTYCHEILNRKAIGNRNKIQTSDKLRIIVQPPPKKRARVIKKIKSRLNKLEKQLNIEQTLVTQLEPHIFLFEGDMKWFNNALTFSVWISIIRCVIKYSIHGSLNQLLLKHSYFRRLETPKRLNKFFSLLPKLFEAEFDFWNENNSSFGINYYLSLHCSQDNSNKLRIWILKNLWNKNVSKT